MANKQLDSSIQLFLFAAPTTNISSPYLILLLFFLLKRRSGQKTEVSFDVAGVVLSVIGAGEKSVRVWYEKTSGCLQERPPDVGTKISAGAPRCIINLCTTKNTSEWIQ